MEVKHPEVYHGLYFMALNVYFFLYYVCFSPLCTQSQPPQVSDSTFISPADNFRGQLHLLLTVFFIRYSVFNVYLLFIEAIFLRLKMLFFLRRAIILSDEGPGGVFFFPFSFFFSPLKPA